MDISFGGYHSTHWLRSRVTQCMMHRDRAGKQHVGTGWVTQRWLEPGLRGVLGVSAEDPPTEHPYASLNAVPEPR